MRNFSVLWMAVIVACVECIYVRQAAHIESEISTNVRSYNGPNKTICDTQACNEAAERIKMTMDRTADPCVDFHKYACGKYDEFGSEFRNDGPNYIQTEFDWEFRGFVNSMSRFNSDVYRKVTEDYRQYLRTFFENEPIDSERPIAKKIRSFFENCTKNIGKKETDTMVLKRLSNAIESMGGWPGLTGNNEANNVTNNWLEQLALLRKNGFQHQIFTSLSAIRFNFAYPRQSNIVRVSLPRIITKDREISYYDDYKHHLGGIEIFSYGDHKQYLAENGRLLISAIDLLSRALSVEKETVRISLTSGLEFEEKLTNISLIHRHPYDKYNITYNLTQMQRFAPEIDWTAYLSELLTPTYYTGTNRRLNLDKVPIKFFHPNATKEIGKLISVTDPKVLTNYVMWRVVREHIRLLEHDRTIPPRWKKGACGLLVLDNFDWPLLSLYMGSFPKRYQALGNIIPIITNEYIKFLEQSDWIDEHLKKQYLTKVQLLLSYNDVMLNDTLIDEFYERFFDEDYYKSLRNIKRLGTDNQYFWYTKNETEMTHWKGRTIEELTRENTDGVIEIAQTFLFLFRDQEKPYYLNFGSLLSEAIRLFLVDSDWLIMTADRNTIMNSTLCKIDPDNKLNFRTLDKNTLIQYFGFVNHIGTFQTAYRAYNEWATNHSDEPQLADLELTPRQLFWILFVRENCGTEGFWNWFVPNMKEFSAAFNCPVGAPMNPAQKCTFF